MSDKERKTHDELANLSDKIKRDVADSINKSRTADTDFWDLGKPKPKVYKKPDFSDTPIEMTDINDSDEAPDNTTQAESISASSGESDKRMHSTAVTPNVRQTVVSDTPPRFSTSSYKRYGTTKKITSPDRKNTPDKDEIVKYNGSGLLIREVEVMRWASDIDFYERFVDNAQISHVAASAVPYTSSYPEVKYFSYVPQYAHMSRAQLDFYRWVRENIRHGRYPSCDSAYIQLYIYEILNLPDQISPAEGAELLAGIWIHYRGKDARFDSTLCEWLPDYCMIHNCPLPSSVYGILPEIVPKAQFKEFYFDIFGNADDRDSMLLLSKTLIENSSDYDFRKSRYYEENKEAFDKHIPLAVAKVVARSIRESGGIFKLNKSYKMIRDSYSGAIVSSHIKRRLNLDFRSFTRAAATRQEVTSIVKYAENKLRPTLGIKAKLGVGELSPDIAAIIDSYFAPLLPKKNAPAKEDKYMPDDYLKNYEASDSGFDFDSAAEIERASWQNTSLLTQGEFESPEEDAFSAQNIEPEETTEIEKEKSCDVSDIEKVEKSNDTEEIEKSKETKKEQTDEDDTLIRTALKAALCGKFHDFCREKRIYDGVLADRINTKFIDIIGDVVLEEDSGSYVIIEDYREDIETWTEK